ncbi:putative oxido YrbE [Cyphellophora attinorum]|uniref:Putative oxido YrbE n=1 Tax=Cyphellophora attinorum TaxID=1664694 RepID=A0A0N1H357_9EURO|nr:putative oxido YrbE [Phialophora attinorum]KPI35895.1 putative oxido YrbE [Phialophora attinorum]
MGSLGDTPIAVVVIGAGNIGSHHAELVDGSQEARLVAIVDPSDNGQALAARFACAYFHDTTSLLRSGLFIDAAIICTPNKTHATIAGLLSEHGVHILLEKPITTTIEDGIRLLETCRHNNTRMCVGHHRRCHASIRAAKHALDSGAIGRCIGVSGVWVALKTQAYFDGPGHWHRDSSGDILLVNLIHEVDLLQYLLGPIVRVHAERAASTRGYRGEEGAAVTLRFGSGVVGTFLALDNAASPFNIEAGTGESDQYPYTAQDCYRLFGTKGALSVPDGRLWQPAHLDQGRKSQWMDSRLNINGKEVYGEQLRNFVAVVRGSEAPVCTGDDGLSAVVVCDAIRESIQTGLPIMLQGT